MTHQPEILAIIPARGGSKGLPGKNIRLLGGHPLISWSILAGLQAKRVTKVLVSTDDKEIAQIGKHYGAEVPFLRPQELALDNSTDVEFMQHALQWLRKNQGFVPKFVVLLRPTSPFRNTGLIDACIEALMQKETAHSIRTVIPAAHTPYKMWKDGGEFLEPILEAPEGIPEPFNAPRQKLPEVLWHVGVVDVIRSATILNLNSASGTNILPHRINKYLAVDIDVLVDFDHAEKQLNQLTDIIQPN